MRIRTQLFLSVVAAILVAAAAQFVVWDAARESSTADEDLLSAQTISHNVSALIVLTQEYANHFEPRAYQQWHERMGELAVALEGTKASRSIDPDVLQAVRAQMRRLPELFSRLGEIADDQDSALSVRRKQFLVDQLITATQNIEDNTARWTKDAVASQLHASTRLRQTIAAALGTMLALMLFQSAWLARRVLKPLRAVEAATEAVEQGRLDIRVGHTSRDEVGQLARRFDAMTTALAERSRQLEEEVRQRLKAEQRIRTITDNVPALIAYLGPDQRYQFTNAYYRQLHRRNPAEFIGRTMQEMLGDAAYEELQPHIQAVLRGERVRYERRAFELGPDVHLMVDYQPDIDAEGQVVGFNVMVLDISARKLAEIRQAQSEERLRSIITHAPDAFISMDASGRITDWNARAEQTFGWTAEEVLGKTVAEVIIPAAARAAHTQGLARFRYTGTGPVIDNRIQVEALHRDGHLIPVELSIGAVQENGRYVANAFLHDISERKAAEAAIAAIQRRLTDVTNSIPALVGYFDCEQRCTYANHPALKLYNLTDEQARGMTMAEILGAQNYEQHRPHVEAALDGRRSFLEGHLLLGGRDVYFQAHLLPDRDAQGEVQGFYVMTFDVTPLKQSERERAAGEQRLRTITDNLPVLIAYIDEHRKVRFCNDTFRHWLDVDTSAMLGHDVAEMVGPQLYAERRTHFDRALSGERVRFEIQSQARGQTVHLQTEYIPDIRPDGTVAGIYTLSVDVTELKKVEQQLTVLARFDTLTGLPNRRQFDDKLQEAWDRAARSGRLMALLFLDVDKFKAINDTLGHAAGDEVLREFALRLTKCVRKTDTVCRLAGDEFVIILEGLHTFEEPQFVARKILGTMTSEFEVLGHQLRVSTSIGIAVLETPTMSPARLLAMADDALYQAKAAGRDTFQCAARTSAG